MMKVNDRVQTEGGLTGVVVMIDWTSDLVAVVFDRDAGRVSWIFTGRVKVVADV
jgi:preprotein translocase subunit YajC